MKYLLLVVTIFTLAGCNGNGAPTVAADKLTLVYSPTVKIGDWQSLEHDFVILIVDGDTTKHMGDTITVTTCKYGCNETPKIKNTIVGGSGGDSDDTGGFNTIVSDDYPLHLKGDSSLKTGWLSLGDITSPQYCDTIGWKRKYDSLVLIFKSMQFHPNN